MKEKVKKLNVTLIVIALGILFFSGWLFFYFIEPTSEVENIQFSNITDTQGSISWTTDKPTRSKVLVSGTGQFPSSVLLAKRVFKDDGEKRLNTSGFYTTHHVTVGGLIPNKTFYYRIYQGMKKVYEGNFTTGSTISSLVGPNPVYGRVLEADGKSPLVGGIVYLQVKDKDKASSLISTLTNSEGGWSLDLSNIVDWITGWIIFDVSRNSIFL